MTVPSTTSPTMVLVELSADRSLILASSATAPVHLGPVGEGWLAQPVPAAGRTVRDAGDPAAAAIVAGVVTIGHALGLTVVAEGVESSAQLDVLRDACCDAAQGWYLSPPVPAGDLAPLLLQEGWRTRT